MGELRRGKKEKERNECDERHGKEIMKDEEREKVKDGIDRREKSERNAIF